MNFNDCNLICLSQKGQGAPGREPVVNEDEQKAMMAHYYRKQEEFKVYHARGIISH